MCKYGIVVTASARLRECSAPSVCTLGIRSVFFFISSLSLVTLYFVIALQVWNENFSLFFSVNVIVFVCVSFFPLVRASACYHTNITHFSTAAKREKYTTKMCAYTRTHTLFSFALRSAVKFSLKWNGMKRETTADKRQRAWESRVCVSVRLLCMCA